MINWDHSSNPLTTSYLKMRKSRLRRETSRKGSSRKSWTKKRGRRREKSASKRCGKNWNKSSHRRSKKKCYSKSNLNRRLPRWRLKTRRMDWKWPSEFRYSRMRSCRLTVRRPELHLPKKFQNQSSQSRLKFNQILSKSKRSPHTRNSRWSMRSF